MPFKKVEMTLKLPKCLQLEKLLLAYVMVLLTSYNFCNQYFHISKNSGDIQGGQGCCPVSSPEYYFFFILQ